MKIKTIKEKLLCCNLNITNYEAAEAICSYLGGVEPEEWYNFRENSIITVKYGRITSISHIKNFFNQTVIYYSEIEDVEEIKKITNNINNTIFHRIDVSVRQLDSVNCYMCANCKGIVYVPKVMSSYNVKRCPYCECVVDKIK